MKTTYLNSKSKIMDLLIYRKIPFDITFTSNTTQIQTADIKYFISDNQIEMKYLSFIGQVKKYANSRPALKNHIYKETIIDGHRRNVKIKIERPKINYMRFSKIENGIYKNLVEIDLNRAYWNIALEKGYLSKELYDKGLEVPKNVRLVALGSLATVKNLYHFDGNQKTFIKEDYNKKTRPFFFEISREVDNLMSNIFDKVPVLWYWVDAFFYRLNTKNKLKRFCKYQAALIPWIKLII